jgi:chromosome segregation ATPase
MSGILSSDSQLIHDELEKAKETVTRLRCINGFTPGFCRNSAVCPGCWRHEQDVTVGKYSEGDGKYSGPRDDPWESINTPYSRVDSDGYGSSNNSVKPPLYMHSRDESYSREMSRGKSSTSRAKSTMSRGDLARVHEQINSLEKNIRGPVLSYIQNIEQQNLDLADAVESIQQHLLKHERDCPAGKMTDLRDMSGGVRKPSEGFRKLSDGGRKLSESGRKLPQTGRNQLLFGESEEDELMQRVNASYKSEQESRFRADNLARELSICREKLENSEARVKELFRNLSQRQVSGAPASSEMLLESQLQRQQQLAEDYHKESTSKERELSFLTIEKYNLQSEVSSLLSDLESCNRKRDEMIMEQKKLQATLGAKRQRISDLQNEMSATKSENRQLRTRFRDELGKECSVSEQKTQKLYANDREIKELGKKVKKFEQNYASHKDVTYRLEKAKLELLSKAKQLSNELKIKESDCKSLRQENEKLTTEIHSVQQEAILSKKDTENANVYVKNLKSELKEVHSSLKVLEQSLTESRVHESKTTTEIETVIKEQLELKSQIEKYESEKIVLTQELTALQTREVEYANEITLMKENYGTSEKGFKDLTENCSALKTELELSREKYLQLKKENDELLLAKADLEKSGDSFKDELTEVTANYNDLLEKNGRVSSDLKAYKRIVGERDEQLKKLELEMNNLHKKQDKDLKDLLRKDKEIAFLKARVSSFDRNTRGGLGAARSLSQSSLSTLQHESAQPSKETEIYLERIVELESECKAQKSQIEKFQKEELYSKKEVQRSDSLKLELAQQDDEIQKLKREISRSKQVRMIMDYSSYRRNFCLDKKNETITIALERASENE